MVTFEKETAAKTALLLNNTQLGPNDIKVVSFTSDALDTEEDVKNEDERKPNLHSPLLLVSMSQPYVS